MNAFNEVLKKYRSEAYSERDKGTRFERLMQAYLKTDPLYADRFQTVWLWNDFPYKSDFGGKDVGIDLVAQTESGDYWAIQCKCFADDAYIDKPAVDSFLATSSRTFDDGKTFAQRLWISTTNRWNGEAEKTIRNQNPPVSRLSLTELENAPVDWTELENGICGAKALKAKYPLKPHQAEALQACCEHFKRADRGRLIMACGTGKTFTSLKIAETEAQNGRVLFLVPSIALLGQTLREWTAQAAEKINPVCVCSDAEITRDSQKNEEDGVLSSIVDLALPASTNVRNIVKQLRYAETQSGMTVVFSTYQSIDIVSEAQQQVGFEFDLIICDEAHRTTGAILTGKTESAFTKVHDNAFIPAKKRLYMTATPRLYRDDVKA